MRHTFLIILSAFAGMCFGQSAEADAETIRSIYNRALTQQQGYKWLKELTDIGPRFAGTEEANTAVFRFQEILDSLGFKTQIQEVTVPVWKRGPQEKSSYSINGQTFKLDVCALGGSVATPENGLNAEVVEITNFDQLDSVNLKGKIAFFNIPMDPTFIRTFYAYGSAVKQRWAGAMEASKRGAIGVVIRSLSSSINDYPHTGSMTYAGSEKKIPAAALSTRSAERLSQALKENESLKLALEMGCQWQDSATSYNLIADLPGTENPDEYILIGGHLDSWDLGTGAHDDGAGSMHAMHAAYLLKELNIRPKRTLRLVFFMNEEFGLNGAKTYAKLAKEESINHVIAYESDGGGFSPRGISMVAPDTIVEKIRSFRDLLEPYGIHRFGVGGAGADINQIAADDIVMIGMRPDSQRYFEVHHSARDVFANVNARELELGSATMASFIYLLDKYDVVAK